MKFGVASAANTYFSTNLPGYAVGIAAGTALTNASTLTTTSYGNFRPNIRITYIPGTTCSGTPNAGSASASASPVCPSTPFSLSLTGNTVEGGLTYQWQSSPNGVTYADISGATTSNYSTSQTADTYYQCIVTCTVGGISSTSTPVFVTTNSFVNCYCTSSATSVADEDIHNVSIGTLNNTSTCTTNGGAGSVQNMYSNYTGLTPPILAASTSYPLSIGIGTCGTGNFSNMAKVWIDFNQNGLFTDPGELVFTTPVGVGAHVELTNITIPATATPGVTRMRVVVVETTVAANVQPCGTYTWGETEDYFVQIAPLPTCPQPTSLAVISADLTSANVSWTPGGGETEWQIEYGPIGFTPGTGTLQFVSPTPNTVISPLASNAFYSYYVRGICSPGDSSYWSGPVSFNTYNQGLYMVTNTDCPTAGFIDISATGVDLLLTDDSEVGITPLPFPVLFQGVLYNSITIGNNGGAQLGSTTAAIGYGGNFNTMANGTMFPWGDDLDDETGNVYVEVIGVSPNQTMIVQWDNICNFSGSLTAPTVTFQLQIDQATNEIWYVYTDVVFGGTNVLDDYGANADIGISGPNQDITISTNNPTYLQNNSCAHFYYTNCPNPTNYSVVYTTTNTAAISWAAGLANETNWTLVYGPTGFDPMLTGTTIQTTSSAVIIPALADGTTFDVYIYSDCSPLLQSNGIFGQFTTLPNCADITGLAGTTAVDSIFTTWNFTANAGFPITEYALQYGMTGYTNGSGTMIYGLDTMNTADTLFDVNLISGGLYQVYVQAICGVDSSNWVGPITVIMPLSNDSTCFAEQLAVDGTVYTMSNAGATVAIGESAIAPVAGSCTGIGNWCNSSMNFTTWFTFVAPASGNVRIDGESGNFNGQIAVYQTANCSNFAQYNLISANDDAATGLYPYLNICGLTPGATYYMVHDSWSTTATGVYTLRLRDVVVEAGSNLGQLNICTGDVVDLSTRLTGADAGGAWSESIPTAGFNDPIWSSAGLAYQVFTFEYMVIDGCAADSVSTSVSVYQEAHAGNDGSITVCLNEPVDLLSGLSGNIDLGGTWYNPSNNPMPNSAITGGTVPGQFNYDYITGNGVCPDDTSNVILIVNPTCNYLNLQEFATEGLEIYPNPTTNIFYISNTGSSEVFNYELTDLNGKIISKRYAAINGSETTEVSVENLETGVYLIHIFNENADKTFRVVKQ